MKEVFYIDDTPGNKISYYFMLVFLVTLPFDRLYSELALIGLLLHTVIHVRRQGWLNSVRWQERLNLSWPGWLVASLYLLTVARTLWSDHRELSFKQSQ